MLLDLFTDDARWGEWARERLTQAARAGAIVLNVVVLAEVAPRFTRIEDLESALPSMATVEAIPSAAAWPERSRVVATATFPKPTAAFARIPTVMPRISAFYGIVITMYWRDHPPAHFHSSYAGHVAKIEIDSLGLLLVASARAAAGQGVGGDAPRRAARRLGPRPRSRRPAPDRPVA